MDRLKEVVMKALASVGVEHDDLEVFTDSVCSALTASFDCLSRGEDDITQALNRAQEKTLKGAEGAGIELDAICDMIEERMACVRSGALTFEEMQALKQQRAKVDYLRDVLAHQQYRQAVRRLQDALQKRVSPEAWAVYLSIEELVNDELWRLDQKQAEGAKW
ncbi:MAG TPA: hypothetical protein GX515_07230 [Firmicutes bacterium]|nr:hypothetical protein [Bacillota bacterium]